jgi:hypothetical protein
MNYQPESKDLYLTTHDTHNIETIHAPAGFEPAIPASERLQTHALQTVQPPGTSSIAILLEVLATSYPMKFMAVVLFMYNVLYVTVSVCHKSGCLPAHSAVQQISNLHLTLNTTICFKNL